MSLDLIKYFKDKFFFVSFKLPGQDKHSINKSHDNCDALPSK